MRSNRVVVPSPTLDDHPGFFQRVEDFPVEQLITQLRVEALAVSVLPRAARHDVGGLGSDRRYPVTYGLGGELRTVIRANVARDAAQDEEVRENFNDVS